MMNRRDLFACLPFLGTVPLFGKLKPGTDSETAVVTAVTPTTFTAEFMSMEREIIHAAMYKIGTLSPGQTPPEHEYTAAKFHLDGMREEGSRGSASQLSLELAHRLLPEIDAGVASWHGDTTEFMQPAEVVIASDPGHSVDHAYLTDEYCDLFYAGQQWDEFILRDRRKSGRPTLVLNRLPMLADVAIARRDPNRPSLTPKQLRALCRAITRRNRDAQMLYNYEFSFMAEKYKW